MKEQIFYVTHAWPPPHGELDTHSFHQCIKKCTDTDTRVLEELCSDSSIAENGTGILDLSGNNGNPTFLRLARLSHQRQGRCNFHNNQQGEMPCSPGHFPSYQANSFWKIGFAFTNPTDKPRDFHEFCRERFRHLVTTDIWELLELCYGGCI
jgi:hypothetical protein